MLCLYQQFMTGHDLFVLTINISLNNNYCHDGFLAFFIKVQFKEKIQIKNTKLFKPGLPKQSLFVSQVSSLASVSFALRNFKIYLSCFSHFQILYLILISSLSGCPENSGVFIGVVANFVKFRFQK